MTRTRSLQLVFGLLGLFLVAGLLAPQFKADRYRSSIQAALERALNRKVAFGDVRYNLLTGPGFTVSKLVIDEDPALGYEPIAYVERVEAIPRLWSLFSGHLAFSSLRLDDAHLNLSRVGVANGEYRWNFEALLRPELVAAFPTISMKASRINFKAGNVKSIVYLLDSSLEIRPPSVSGRPWRFEFEGNPARTDRPARESGVVRATGQWRPGSIDADLALERSDLEDLLAVVRGEDIGLHGLISGRARFHGPPSAIAIDGAMQVEDLHGWDQSVPKGESWPLDLHGQWNAPAQQVQLDARILDHKKPVVSVHYNVDRYLTQPRWGVSVSLARLPIEPLLPVVRHLGAALPGDFRMTGTIAGEMRFSDSGGFQGDAAFREARIAAPGLPALAIEEARVVASDGHIRLLPADVVSADQLRAALDADYEIATQRAAFHISARALPVAVLGKQTSLAAIPLLSAVGSGAWSGDLTYSQQPGVDPQWTGNVELAEAAFSFPGFASPVTLHSAEAHIEGAAVSLQRISAEAGDIEFAGDYRYEPGALRPHRFHLVADEVAAPALERLFLPTLRRGSLLGIALRFGRTPIPDWLRLLRADGSVQIAKLEFGPVELDKVRTRVLWDSTHVTFPDLTAALPSGSLTARAHADLRNSFPGYEASVRLTGVEWKGGTLEADSALATRGTGPDVLANLHAAGSFNGHDLLEDVETAAGRYDFAWRLPVPRLTLDDLRITSATDSYAGKGALQDDGSMLLQLSTGARQVSVAVNVGSASSPLSTGSFKW